MYVCNSASTLRYAWTRKCQFSSSLFGICWGRRQTYPYFLLREEIGEMPTTITTSKLFLREMQVRSNFSVYRLHHFVSSADLGVAQSFSLLLKFQPAGAQVEISKRISAFFTAIFLNDIPTILIVAECALRFVLRGNTYAWFITRGAGSTFTINTLNSEMKTNTC